MSVRRLQRDDFREWSCMRRALWPHVTLAECRKELETVRRQPSRFATFVSQQRDGQLDGFLEASIRRDYVNGCMTSPVGYIEGLFVAHGARRKGIGRKLVRAAERWARAKGCKEMGSDAKLANRLSHKVHYALCYANVNTLVHFHKRLR